MGERNIRKEAKKPKKSDKQAAGAAVSVSRPITTQPELIKKVKKTK